MKIIIENSTWNNVGDGWYQTALFKLLKDMYPSHEVYIGEGPIKRAFRINNKKQLKNSLELMFYEQGDIHVFSGPILHGLLSNYSEKIKEIKKRNAEYALISISGCNMTTTEIQELGSFLKEYPPLFTSTRDEITYHYFKDYIKNIYNGICTAFLVDKLLPIQQIKLEKPFFISSFYTELEPTYSIKNNKSVITSIEDIKIRHHKTMFKIPHRYSRHLDFLRKHQEEIGGYLIVRTIQNLNTRFNHINFATPNSFISFNPVSYINVTKSCEFVISDRVHACAIGLACNKPVKFTFNTPRAGIFERMGFDYRNNNGIMYPNMDKIELEMYNLQNEIKKYI